jgi:phenylalanyl-tRNA synthetase alpha chain
MVELRRHERRTLSTLSKLSGKAMVKQIVDEGELPDSAVMRAALTLQEKKLVRITEEKQTIARLTGEGKTYVKNGLPERRLVLALEELNGKAPLKKTVEKAGLEGQLIPIALGWIQRKKWATLDTKTGTLQLLEKPERGADEKLIRLLDEKGKATVEDLSPELQDVCRLLRGRKLLSLKKETKRIIELTELGRASTRERAEVVTEVTQLTPELIVTGKWRKAKIQRYNIEAPVARNWLGKKHPYLHFIDQVKTKLVNLGFKEMTGPNVENCFFNFDALYTPQDHPAREIFDIYLVKSPKYGSIDASQQVLENVKKTHENGWKTGSTGWKYRYSVKEARRLILRGHGTCLSARTLLSKDLEIPGRYFSIARCYRPDVPDKTHLTEFNQVEGIVVDESLTLRDLLGILETFAIQIAEADKVRLKPDYYPFTEPSVELSAYKRGYGWIEFGGSGIFRPEVTMPLGIDAPVIAWGLGIDRLFMMKAGVDDIREIFSKNLYWLRVKELV